MADAHRKLAATHNGHDWHGATEDGKWFYCESCKRLAQLLADFERKVRLETMEYAARTFEDEYCKHQEPILGTVRALKAIRAEAKRIASLSAPEQATGLRVLPCGCLANNMSRCPVHDAP